MIIGEVSGNVSGGASYTEGTGSRVDHLPDPAPAVTMFVCGSSTDTSTTFQGLFEGIIRKYGQPGADNPKAMGSPAIIDRIPSTTDKARRLLACLLTTALGVESSGSQKRPPLKLSDFPMEVLPALTSYLFRLQCF